ncbi:hypothetical protein FXW26_00795 [Candidatus Liberibacter asiaticus]|nr:hypothetical protein FXW26_00795 [Candidatus Liberibacter asiaticus]
MNPLPAINTESTSGSIFIRATINSAIVRGSSPRGRLKIIAALVDKCPCAQSRGRSITMRSKIFFSTFILQSISLR